MSTEDEKYDKQTAQVYQNPEGWRFRIKGGNGEIIATGEVYDSFNGAIEGLHRVHPGIVVTKVDPLEGQQGIP